MNYKVGDRVVCIDSRKIVDPTRLKVGAHYTIAWIGKCCASAPTLVRVKEIPTIPRCLECGCQTGDFRSWRFVKLDGLTEQETTKESITA